MQLNKNIKLFLNYFLGPLLFLWLAFSIYNQIRNQPGIAQSWREIKESFFSSRVLLLLAMILLMPLNWGLEGYKWQKLVRPIRAISFLQALKAVLTGVSFSVTMPNRVGEYVGRMMYMPEGSRLKTISAALVGSLAQLITTLVFGLGGLALLKKHLLAHYPAFIIWYQFVFYALFILLLIFLWIYFNVDVFVTRIRKWFGENKYLYLVESLSNFNGRFLIHIIIISFLRYGVFLAQYILVFYFFHLEVSPEKMVLVTNVIFLAMAVIPSIALVEIGLRGEVSLKLMGMFSANTLAIGLASVTIWFLNLILPAVIGSLLLLNLKLLKKNET
ncbi:MAG: lysylphosphatidylglycerol synthase domain-containing protein [Flavisolibacter sp.]